MVIAGFRFIALRMDSWVVVRLKFWRLVDEGVADGVAKSTDSGFYNPWWWWDL
jgi:hypothetical protein